MWKKYQNSISTMMTVFQNILKKISLKEVKIIAISKDMKKPQYMNRLRYKMKVLRNFFQLSTENTKVLLVLRNQ